MNNHIIYNQILRKFKIYNLSKDCFGFGDGTSSYTGDGGCYTDGDAEGDAYNSSCFGEGNGKVWSEIIYGINRIEFNFSHCHNFNLDSHDKD